MAFPSVLGGHAREHPVSWGLKDAFPWAVQPRKALARGMATRMFLQLCVSVPVSILSHVSSMTRGCIVLTKCVDGTPEWGGTGNQDENLSDKTAPLSSGGAGEGQGSGPPQSLQKKDPEFSEPTCDSPTNVNSHWIDEKARERRKHPPLEGCDPTLAWACPESGPSCCRRPQAGPVHTLGGSVGHSGGRAVNRADDHGARSQTPCVSCGPASGEPEIPVAPRCRQ